MRLTDDLLLEVFYNCDLSTLRALRLASRTCHGLIETYGYSISSKVLPQYHPQELIRFCLPLESESYSAKGMFEIDRRVRLGKLMAFRALVDQEPKMPRTDPEASEEELTPVEGYQDIYLSDMWTLVAVGLGVMWYLSTIARNILQKELPEVTRTSGSTRLTSATRGSQMVSDVERKVLEVQIRHIQTLPEPGLRGLTFALAFCVRAIVYKRALEVDQGGFHLRLSLRELKERQKWTEWLLLREGPYFIATTWKSLPNKERSTRFIVRELTFRSDEQRAIEKRAISSFYDGLHDIPQVGYYSKLKGGPPCDFFLWLSPRLVAEESNGEDVLKSLVEVEELASVFAGDVSLPLGQDVSVMSYAETRSGPGWSSME
jgi:hypothetical protein